MTQSEAIANLKRIEKMIWAFRQSLEITKEDMRFAPLELSRAIGFLYKAQDELKGTIKKLTEQ